MKVYHGTDYKYLDSILKNGITPRYDKTNGRSKKKGNWKEAQSHKDMVYTSTAYPWFYAVNAKANFKKGVVFEIDLDLLDKSNFYPDEDFVFQIMKNEEESIQHNYIKENLTFFKYLWEDSLNKMGNVCHKGIIPISSVTRYCIIDFIARKEICFEMLQPSISIENFYCVGQKYIDLNKWCFGDIDELPFVEIQKYTYQQHKELEEFKKIKSSESTLLPMIKKSIELWEIESKKREGIEVVVL